MTAKTAPVIIGSRAVGSRLTASMGTWSPVPSSVTYTWLRNGAGIKGATAISYVPTIGDAAAKISVRVTAHHSGYRDASSTSSAVVIPRPVVRNTARPTITGTARVGYILQAHPGSWSPAATSVTYRWLRDGHPIALATRSTYKAVAADRGHLLSVMVTAARAQYTTSAPALSPGLGIK
jgi:hypothetical protein